MGGGVGYHDVIGLLIDDDTLFKKEKKNEWELEHRGIQERGFRSPLARIGIGLFSFA